MTGESRSGRWPDYWDPDDLPFWESEGRRIANRNLWISTPNLLLAFAVWIYWGMVAKYIQQLHFATGGELFNFTFMNGGEPYEEPGYRALLFILPAFVIAVLMNGFRLEGIGILWAILKLVAVVLLLTLIRNTNPRIKIKQAIRFFFVWMNLLAIIAIVLAIFGL